ncbi:MAG: 4'-phosphopantetheinyl transferase superfamily protein [Flavobacteriales bacterium]|nr:4'-phosphopantetheinyl transferase superfamily protein [Flavobacteriales bacterium]MDG1781268.1 4'-phosphopantetheinyl transferase superfamily protein [Flavobacteriales bacterium]MDG2246257.1 4'-phosphopantetheinyl transferase superfamily protein [Flavobacteriales bacterium]
MPLLAEITLPEKVELAFWLMTESTDELVESTPLSKEDKIEWDSLRHNKRKKEWIASRAALRTGLQINDPILYHETGKPYAASTEISLSHCLPLAGALKHGSFAGFDIQHPDPKIAVIKTKFANAPELKEAEDSGDELNYLTIIWSAKEAIFKVYGENLAFADEMRIHPFTIGQEVINATISREDNSIEHVLRVFKIHDHWVVVVVK